ncbi:MAG TPA: hypothetical protein VKV02_11145 [Acidobacteriaceae bacterium]|nr:hypothetical protein [Acidobacteriaceae bacterium]
MRGCRGRGGRGVGSRGGVEVDGLGRGGVLRLPGAPGFEFAVPKLEHAHGPGLVDVGFRGDEAVDGVFGDLFDGFLGAGRVDGLGAGEVVAGDLEAVEQEAGAAGVDVVGGELVEDLGDGVLDAGAVGELGRGGEDEVGLAGDLEIELVGVAGVGFGAAGGVVVVAEVFAFEAGAAAAVAVGEDVAALEAAGLDVGGVVHAVPLPRVLLV